MTRLEETIGAFLRAEGLEPQHVLVALSGGADSVALLLALHEYRDRAFKVSAAHVHHHLRAEADDDARFVMELCTRLGIELEMLDADITAERIRAVGVEAAAREARYALLDEAADRIGADCIATAHTRNDQAETLLMRLITGSGASRLRGISPRRGRIIRPLLTVSRAEIEQFVEERGIEPRRDAMNEDPRYLRSSVRHRLLPLLAELNPRIVDSLAETAQQVFDQQNELDAAVKEAHHRFVRTSDDHIDIDATSLGDRPWMLRRLILDAVRKLEPEARDVSAEDLHRLQNAVARTSVTRDLSIRRHHGVLRLERAEQRDPIPDELQITPGGTLEIPNSSWQLRLEEVPSLPPRESWSSASHQLFEIPPGAPAAFTVRSRRRGDRFLPLGSSSEKKLKDFLINRKIDKQDRASLPLLICDNEIVWIPGVEVSERFRVREGRGRLFRASLERSDGNGEALRR